MKTYKINEIFYSLQGEGYMFGVPATFIRFSGCNLKCPFCDTNFKNFNKMTIEEIIDSIKDYESSLVVLTGGEPTLQVDQELIDALHEINKYVAIETNGTNNIDFKPDWVTVSPKSLYLKKAELELEEANEIKIVVDNNINDEDIKDYESFKARRFYIQPCDVGNPIENEKIIQRCIDFIKDNPKWRLSLQTQKILKIQ